MPDAPSDIAFTPAVKAIQTANGSRETYERMERGPGWRTEVSPDLAEFLSTLDMFYLGTATAEGQPYIQYRGGTPGFLKSIGPTTLAFADFGGNRQYLTVGNLSENPKAFLFLMDYENRRRIKIWGRARIVEGDGELLTRLADPGYYAAAKRAVVFEIEAWDINCPQHIHRRYSEAEVAARIAELEKQVAALKARLGE